MEQFLRLHPVLIASVLTLHAATASAQTNNPTIGNVSFGQVSSLYSDLTSRQNTCAFGSLLGVRYSVLANGSGAGGAFTVGNGVSNLPYELQWASTSNATSGSNVTANVPLTGQTEAALGTLGCLLGVYTATAIVIFRASSLQQATAGSYNGTLTVLLTVQ